MGNNRVSQNRIMLMVFVALWLIVSALGNANASAVNAVPSNAAENIMKAGRVAIQWSAQSAANLKWNIENQYLPKLERARKAIGENGKADTAELKTLHRQFERSIRFHMGKLAGILDGTGKKDQVHAYALKLLGDPEKDSLDVLRHKISVVESALNKLVSEAVSRKGVLEIEAKEKSKTETRI